MLTLMGSSETVFHAKKHSILVISRLFVDGELTDQPAAGFGFILLMSGDHFDG